MLNKSKKILKSAFDITASQFGPHNRPSKESRLWVLMYHRILPEADARYQLEEPGMIITPETLNMHITEAKNLFTMVSLNDWVERYHSNQALPEKACAITFDDGWLDNVQYAAPILLKHKVPATLFAVVDKIGSDFRFWPNIVAELINANYHALGQHPLFAQAHTLANRTFSKESLAVVIADLKQHSEETIFAALEEIQWQKGLLNADKALLDWEQLSASPFEIGCHTNTHRRLTTWLDNDALLYEIQNSKEKLASLVGRAQPLFCYPNGDYSDQALNLVRQNYSAAVTTQRGINTLHNLDVHQLKRIPLHNDISNTPSRFRARLSAWKAL
jgi:peptidoglycan/xylan/chitin deacetylase (PgdA/CDA1 family)